VLPPYAARDDLTWIHGGDRALLELAAAAAQNGVDVELRGAFMEREVAEVERFTNVTIGRPRESGLPAAGDTVVIPEGTPDPLLFARAALSPARAVLLLMAAPGLFGWPFDRERVPEDPTVVDPQSVGRAEQLVAARHFGFELWTNARGIAAQARDAGIPHHYLGIGRPVPYPDPVPKRVDVVTLAANRWSALAREAAGALRPGLTREEIGKTSHARLLTALGEARIFIHPARIEGVSRLSEEARAMGTVPILLASNRFGDGMDEASGAVTVGTVEEIAPAVHDLLDDPARLDALAAAGRQSSREAVAWDPFVRRIGEVLAAPDLEVARFARGRAGFGARLAEREDEVRRRVESAAATAQAHAVAAREQEVRVEVNAALSRAAAAARRADAAARHADAASAALAAAETRLQALRSRKAVRLALRASGALALVRRRVGT
jgi:hypothetical protein